jgi:hypothetical protein
MAAPQLRLTKEEHSIFEVRHIYIYIYTSIRISFLKYTLELLDIKEHGFIKVIYV